MRRQRLLLCIILAFGLCVSLMAHPGRTDANGGHFNRKTGEYHYHNGGPARPTLPPITGSQTQTRTYPQLAPANAAPSPATPVATSSQRAISPEALKRLIQRAEAGDAASQHQLAERYLTGDGVEKDAAQAREWFEKSAKGGNRWAEKKLLSLTNLNEIAPTTRTNFAVEIKQSVSQSVPKQEYWITDSTGKRHNSTCRYFQGTKGRACTRDQGIACQICSG